VKPEEPGSDDGIEAAFLNYWSAYGASKRLSPETLDDFIQRYLTKERTGAPVKESILIKYVEDMPHKTHLDIGVVVSLSTMVQSLRPRQQHLPRPALRRRAQRRSAVQGHRD